MNSGLKKIEQLVLNTVFSADNFIIADVLLTLFFISPITYLIIFLCCVYNTNLFLFQFCNTKLMALNLLTELSKYVTADIILDRILPYMVRCLNHFYYEKSWLKCSAITLAVFVVVVIVDIILNHLILLNEETVWLTGHALFQRREPEKIRTHFDVFSLSMPWV